jgi:putative NADH-flavin reductase
VFTNLCEELDMKLVVFGASGRIGAELVRQSLAAGHQVTAVVREGSLVEAPARAGVGVGGGVAARGDGGARREGGVPGDGGLRGGGEGRGGGGVLEVVTADAMDPEAAASVIAGQDAVLSALGPRGGGPTTVLSDGARSVVSAMQQTGVRRLLVVSVAGIHTTGDDPFTKCVVKPILGRILRESFADARRMEELVRSSDLDWTLICPPRLTNGAGKGRIRSNTEGTVRGGFSITRADVATYLLAAVADDSVLRRTAVIAN